MDESRKVKPTAKKIDHLMGEMKLLTQEMLGRDAYTRRNDYEFVDQKSLEEHNVAVAGLGDRWARATATLNKDELAEKQIITDKFSIKLQVLEADFDKQQDDLDEALDEKNDRNYKIIQEEQAKTFLQKFEEKARDILLSKSPEQENAIPTLGSDLAIPGTATGAAVDTPSTSFAGESTMPVSRTERVIQGQYLVASSDGKQSLFVHSPEFGPRVPSTMGASVDSYRMTASLGFRPSRTDDHSIKRQKTKAFPSTLIERERSPSMNDAPYLRDRLGIQVPTQSSSMASNKPFGSRAQSWLPSVDTAGRDCGLGREKAAIPRNDFVPRNSASTRFQPAFTQQPFASRRILDFSNGPSAFAQIARQGYSSSQISSPFMGASRYALSNAGLTDNASRMGEKQRTGYRQGQLMTPLKRKALDVNLSDLYDETYTSRTGAPIQIQKKPDGVSKFRAVRPSATNSSSASGASRNWSGQAPQFGRQEGIKEEPASEVTGVSRSMNVESAQMSIPVHQPSYVEAMQSKVLTPRHSNVGSSGRTITGTGSSSSESSGPVAVTHKLRITEAERYFLLIPIEYISYNAGAPSRSFPVTWSGKKGIHNPGQHFGQNYSLQVKLRKNGVLHPYDGADDKSAQYPTLVVDGSWILGGFCHRKSGNCRIEIYRPRSSKKYMAKLEEGHDRVEIQSARLRIVIAEERDLDHFLHWYRKLNPNAEIRPDDRLGFVRGFHDERGESDPELRREIEDRAQRCAPVAPVAVNTSA
ncbi:uncharacterized protein EAE97_008916 [Botrytis byssoidea]|uniref:Uncharacterized protein n=1 Tax=Botrytis byssoidea TaxID=139641 RepID=A0A9P5ICU5_9HELO|nr:uncharacterized protein EAE97_008916 [Botrytis byssoidea]KAF7933149.1 hypothetical protein EAE97_008916 [Botrytis byssoidea]